MFSIWINEDMSVVQEKLQYDKTLVGMHQYSDRKPYGNTNILHRNNIYTIGF